MSYTRARRCCFSFLSLLALCFSFSHISYAALMNWADTSLLDSGGSLNGTMGDGFGSFINSSDFPILQDGFDNNNFIQGEVDFAANDNSVVVNSSGGIHWDSSFFSTPGSNANINANANFFGSFSVTDAGGASSVDGVIDIGIGANGELTGFDALAALRTTPFTSDWWNEALVDSLSLSASNFYTFDIGQTYYLYVYSYSQVCTNTIGTCAGDNSAVSGSIQGSNAVTVAFDLGSTSTPISAPPTLLLLMAGLFTLWRSFSSRSTSARALA